MVSRNWQIDHKSFYYPDQVKNLKEYNRLVISMMLSDESKLNWTVYEISKIYGSDFLNHQKNDCQLKISINVNCTSKLI